MQTKQSRILGTFSTRISYVRTLTVLPYCRTAIGLRVKDGVVLAVEKLVHSKLLVPEANRRIQNIDRHIGLVRRFGVGSMFIFSSHFYRQQQVCKRMDGICQTVRVMKSPTTAQHIVLLQH
jgi:hypothetical protein